jgi:NADPH:quinone reductase-like Zn-dependent oxidoreductase
VTNGADDDLLARGIGFNVHSQPTPENLEAINSLVEAGLLRTPVTAEFPFEKIADAFDRQRSAGRGKIAVSLISAP